MCLRGGHALVPQVCRQREVLAEHSGVCLRLCGLRALVSGWIEGKADDNFCKWPETHKAVKVAQVVTPVGAGEGGIRLHGGPVFICQGDADATVADIEAKYAGHGSIVETA